MAEFKKKNTKNFWDSPITLVVLFCILVVFSYNMFGLIQKERETSAKKVLILDNIDALNKREVMLKSDIAKLSTDEGIEETIRDKYQVAKPDEKMVVIVDDQNTNASNDQDEKNSHSFWGWIKKTFSKSN